MVSITPNLITLTQQGQTFFTHSSLLEDKTNEGLKTLQEDNKTTFKRAFFISLYASLEAVNRLPFLKNLAFSKRAGIVGVVPLVLGFAAKSLTTPDEEVLRLLDGAPVYKNRAEVPELDKMYFFLDDDNNYEPSLYYHGL